ncbi:MAG: GTP-binding protein, partial [Candidatus Micrarchaeia archaeon]
IIEQIRALEKELSKTKYNKRTEHAIGLLKVKIARLKEQLEARREAKRGSKGPSYAVRKSGDATVALIGLPSVGKSTLINRLTNANSKTASYNFTTLECIPGLLEYKQAKIQILDLPGILGGAAEGTGRGKEAISVLRNADLILLVVEAYDVQRQLETVRKELYNAGIRLNQHSPDVKIEKKERGGINITATVKLSNLTREDVASTLKEFKIMNADVIIKEDISLGQFIDAVAGNRKYSEGLIVVNKIDMVGEEEIKSIKEYIESLSKKSAILKNCKEPKAVFISAENNTNLEELKEAIYQRLDFIRVYLKEVGKDPDLEKPMILRRGATIRDACLKIHTDFPNRLRFARVWGPSAKFPGQKFKLEHQLSDTDILQLHLK